MNRVAFVMKLKPGCEEIYKQKHDEIWPEMLEQMRARGTRSYSIYRYGLLLFAYQENEDGDQLQSPPTELTRRWWRMMEPYMEYGADGKPWREQLQEMFHFE